MAAVKAFADWAACVGHVMEFAGGRGVPVWEVWVGLSTYKVGMEGGQVSGGSAMVGGPEERDPTTDGDAWKYCFIYGL